MAAYAKIYGFQVVDRKHIKGREEEYTWLGDNCYLSNSEYEMSENFIPFSFGVSHFSFPFTIARVH